jgi:hypothetical protein
MRKSRGPIPDKAYRSWSAMKTRCKNGRIINAKDYSGRGISFQPSWEKFENFLEDMGLPPSMKHSLDRIDNDKGYSKENCRWADAFQQAQNRRYCIKLTARGETKTLAEWCRQVALSQCAIQNRLELGMSHEDAIFTPFWKVRQSLTEDQVRRARLEFAKGRPVKEVAVLIGANRDVLSALRAGKTYRSVQ